LLPPVGNKIQVKPINQANVSDLLADIPQNCRVVKASIERSDLDRYLELFAPPSSRVISPKPLFVEEIVIHGHGYLQGVPGTMIRDTFRYNLWRTEAPTQVRFQIHVKENQVQEVHVANLRSYFWLDRIGTNRELHMKGFKARMNCQGEWVIYEMDYGTHDEKDESLKKLKTSIQASVQESISQFIPQNIFGLKMPTEPATTDSADPFSIPDRLKTMEIRVEVKGFQAGGVALGDTGFQVQAQGVSCQGVTLVDGSSLKKGVEEIIIIPESQTQKKPLFSCDTLIISNQGNPQHPIKGIVIEGLQFQTQVLKYTRNDEGFSILVKKPSLAFDRIQLVFRTPNGEVIDAELKDLRFLLSEEENFLVEQNSSPLGFHQVITQIVSRKILEAGIGFTFAEGTFNFSSPDLQGQLHVAGEKAMEGDFNQGILNLTQVSPTDSFQLSYTRKGRQPISIKGKFKELNCQMDVINAEGGVLDLQSDLTEVHFERKGKTPIYFAEINGIQVQGLNPERGFPSGFLVKAETGRAQMDKFAFLFENGKVQFEGFRTKEISAEISQVEVHFFEEPLIIQGQGSYHLSNRRHSLNLTPERIEIPSPDGVRIFRPEEGASIETVMREQGGGIDFPTLHIHIPKGSQFEDSDSPGKKSKEYELDLRASGFINRDDQCFAFQIRDLNLQVSNPSEETALEANSDPTSQIKFLDRGFMTTSPFSLQGKWDGDSKTLQIYEGNSPLEIFGLPNTQSLSSRGGLGDGNGQYDVLKDPALEAFYQREFPDQGSFYDLAAKKQLEVLNLWVKKEPHFGASQFFPQARIIALNYDLDLIIEGNKKRPFAQSNGKVEMICLVAANSNGEVNGEEFTIPENTVLRVTFDTNVLDRDKNVKWVEMDLSFGHIQTKKDQLHIQWEKNRERDRIKIGDGGQLVSIPVIGWFLSIFAPEADENLFVGLLAGFNTYLDGVKFRYHRGDSIQVEIRGDRGHSLIEIDLRDFIHEDLEKAREWLVDQFEPLLTWVGKEDEKKSRYNP